jgi:hypothetical protein
VNLLHSSEPDTNRDLSKKRHQSRRGRRCGRGSSGGGTSPHSISCGNAFLGLPSPAAARRWWWRSKPQFVSCPLLLPGCSGERHRRQRRLPVSGPSVEASSGGAPPPILTSRGASTMTTGRWSSCHVRQQCDPLLPLSLCILPMIILPQAHVSWALETAAPSHQGEQVRSLILNYVL